MRFFLLWLACVVLLTPWSSSADTTGGQFLATTRCSSTSSASSELLGEKTGLLATPPLKQNGSVTWAVFGVQMLNVWKNYALTNLL